MALNQLLLDAQQIENTVVVLDLDSTLFCTAPRSQAIMEDFSKEPDFLKKYAAEIEILKFIKIRRTDWGIKEPLLRINLSAKINFFDDLRKYWVSNFFTDHYLQYDTPYEGAVEFVQELSKTKARIVYLTGRDRIRMLQGTKDSLKKWDFPFPSDENLVLKPKAGLSDSNFKKDVVEGLLKDHSHMWFIENEPVNLKIVEDHFPEVKLLFFDSTHSNRLPSPKHIPSLDFKFEFHNPE